MKKSFAFAFKLISVVCVFALFVNTIQAQSAASKSVLVTVGNPAGCPIGAQAATYYQPYVLMYRGNIIGGTAQNIYSCQVAWAPTSPTDYPDTYFSTFIEFDPAVNDLIITKAKQVTNDSTRVYVAGFATNSVCDPVNLNFVQPSGVRMNGLIADPLKRHQILLSSGAYNLADLDLATGDNTNLKPITYVPGGSDPSTAAPNGWDIAFTSNYQSIYWLIHDKLYRIDNLNSASPTAYFLLDLPLNAGDAWVGVAYYNTKVLLGKINQTTGGCTVAEWDPATSTLSAQVTFPSSDGFVDFTSFTTSVGAAKKLISATQVAGTTYDLVFEVFGKNLGTTPLNNFQIVDDLSGVFGALNIVSISPINATSNGAGLAVNPAFNGTTDKNLIAANQTLPNFINNSITLQFTVRVKNASPGITYFNYAIASGNARNGQSVQDISNDYSGFGETANLRVDIDLNEVADDPAENNATPWSLPDDTENDGIPFYIDIDDDNDGIVDTLECPRTLTPSSFVNGSFETPVLGGIAANKVFNGTVGFNWKTTTPTPNDYVEVWSGGFGATPTVCGTQIVELNASGIGTIYQKFKIPPSATIKWTMKHRGRFGTDIARVSLGTALDSLTTTYLLSDGNSAWGSYTGYYSAPAYADSVVISIASLSNAAPVTTFNPDTVGNLIDCVTLEVIDVPCSTDSDGDQLIDSRDLDSDNDGIPDLVEAGGVDVNGDGSADVVIDADADGLIDQYDSSTGGVNIGLVDGDGNQYTLRDSEGDGVPDFRDIDSDNDGITDATEVGATDANGDGRVDNASETDFDGLADAYDGDIGNDGTAEATANAVLPTLADANADGKPEGYTKGDFDGDKYLNYLDIDSDNDGITDNTEGQATATYAAPSGNDTDGDGLDNAYDIDNAGTAVVPVNTDGADNPDYLDLDTDNDTRIDATEGHDTDGDGFPDAGSPAATGINNISTTDADADGLLDVYDNNTAVKDATNGALNPTSHPDIQKPGGDRDWRSLTKDVRIAKLISPASIYGGLLVFHNPNGTAGAHIFTCNPGGGNEKVVASAVDPEYDPVFFPSGSKIMWARNGVDFWTMNPDGTNPSLFKAVTAPAQGYQANPSFKRDESEYVFVSQSSNSAGDLFVTKVAGGIPSQLTFSPGFENHPSYSVDGSKVYYDYDFGGDQELYVMNADGSNSQQLTNTVGRNARPSVSPDGTKIIFMSSRDGNNEIYVMNIDGTNAIRVTNSPDDDVEPKWTPDGKKVLFSRATAFPDFDIYFIDPLVGETSVTPARPTQLGFTFDPKQQSLILTGSTITYKVLISNDATTSASVNFNDILPANTTFVSATAPAGWSISTPTVGTAGGTVSGNNVALPVGTDTITITVKLDQKYALDKTVLANTASITSADDDFPSNNTSTSNNFIASDKDLDGIPDYIDIDDDNDGILDLVEAPSDPLADADNDGTPNQSDPQFCASTTLNSNGMCAEFDNDGDGIPNHLDIDSDNDGITDVTEAGGSDPDNNGQIGTGLGTTIADTDGDGYADVVDTDNGGTALNPPNTDVSGKPNYVDIDADGDGIVDNIEGQSTSGYVTPTGVDADEDGLDDAYDTVVGFSGNGVTPNNNDATDNPDYIDLDTDNDGVADNIEGWDINGSGVINGTEKTASGVDADNDGLDDGYDANTSAVNPTNSTTPTSYPDVVEPGNDRDWRDFNDHDNDGIANGTDLDDDNDGILDTIEGTADKDGDGVIDSFDLDSDNDGIPDLYESDRTPTQLVSLDANNDGVIDGAVGTNGIPDAGETTVDSGVSIVSTKDSDGDGHRDHLDLDTDNDGITDILESGHAGLDANGDGIVDGTDTDNDGIINVTAIDNNTTFGGSTISNPDFDNDGKPNTVDLDADNDGITDVKENNGTDANNDGMADGTDTDNDGIVSSVDSNVGLGGSPITLINTDSFGNSNYLDIDADNDGIVDNIEGQSTTGYVTPTGIDTDGDGIDNAYDTTVGFGGAGVNPNNNDGTDNPDYTDLDADNDGRTDIIEGWDTNNSGTITGTEKTFLGVDLDGDGLDDGFDSNTGAVNPTNGTTPTSYPDVDKPGGDRDWREILDHDNDGITDVTDLDDDNDGVPDTIEGSADTDGDGIKDSFDLDSDNDGIPDVREAGGVDVNGDGIIDGFVDTDNDGLSDTVDTDNGGTALTNPDTDGDGKTDSKDLDSDNDGITDVREAGGTDANGDGIIDGFTDTDNDGLSDNVDPVGPTVAGTPLVNPDTDGDGRKDYVDLDSDNDGITDVRENGQTSLDANNDGMIDGTDTDGDGIINASGVDNNSTYGGTTATLVNSDSDNKPDYVDIDSDNDGIVDNVEGQSTSGYVAPTGVDTDGDGIDNAYDTINGFGGAGVTPNNQDGTDNPDYTDLDTDNDGRLDTQEGWDTNGDGIISGGEKTSTGVDADNDGLDDGYDNNTTASNPTNGTTPTSYPDVDLPGNDRDWREIPGVIGVAKSVSTPILNADGTYSITYKVVVKNLSVGAMGNISVVENLSATFPTPTTYTITAFPTVTPAGTGLTLNGGFNGSTQTGITTPAASSLGVGRTDTITFTVKVKPNGYFGPFNNTVTISGNNGGIAVTDSSTTGNNPDPNGNGNPNDPGENITTPVTFTPNSIIGVAKSASTPEPSGTGLSYIIVYKVKVKNYGNDTLKNVQVIDDLSVTIPLPATYTVSGISATGTVDANLGYNGSSVTGLLNASSSKLNPGDSATITFTIVVTPNGVGSISNSATATGTGQLGNTVSDVSTNGTNPDTDGDGNPTESTEDEPTVSLLPSIELSIPEGFSPNLDGVNDFLVIKGIALYPKNKFTVMNRWGNVVYEASGYMDTWDGKANVGTHIGTDELPVGTYFYILDLGNNSTPLKGYIYLNR